MSTELVAQLDNNMIIVPEDKIKKSIFKEYERVILDSLLQTFALDFIIQDQHGGDVDTIHNLEQVGKDPLMKIKNADTKAKYENRGEYDSHAYHSNKSYIDKNRELSAERKTKGIKDAYTGETLHQSHDLDHVISAKEMHDNAAIYATNISPVSLANSDDNLVPTIASVNRSKGAKTIDQFLSDWESTRPMRQKRIKELKNKTTLSDKERKELKKYKELEKLKPEEVKRRYKKAKEAYRNKVNKSYYTSSKFAYDTVNAAVTLGGKMGVKQVVGFVLLEVWFAIKKRIANCNEFSLKGFFSNVLEGIKDGFISAKTKYKEILAKFKEGLISGIISSLMTTLTNMVKTLLASSIKVLRHASSAIVQSIKILFFDKHNSLQERIHSVLVLLATTASAVVGGMMGAYLGPTLSAIPIVGEILLTFLELFVSGIISCTLIYFIDKWELAQKIYAFLKNIDMVPLGDYAEYMKQQVAYYHAYVAELLKIDVEALNHETQKYQQILDILESDEPIHEINIRLKAAMLKLSIELPWEGDFSSFMANKNNRLVFK